MLTLFTVSIDKTFMIELLTVGSKSLFYLEVNKDKFYFEVFFTGVKQITGGRY